MTVPRSDALVVFGATGDLAYKKIFPALQALVRRGHLDVPIIGVARSPWTLDQLKARAKDSLENHSRLGPAAYAKPDIASPKSPRRLRPCSVCFVFAS